MFDHNGNIISTYNPTTTEYKFGSNGVINYNLNSDEILISGSTLNLNPQTINVLGTPTITTTLTIVCDVNLGATVVKHQDLEYSNGLLISVSSCA